MITYFQDVNTCRLTDLGGQIIRQLRGLPSKVSAIGQINKVFRFEFLCEPIDPLTWLNNQKADQKFYWADRNHQFEMAGIKAAVSITEVGTIDFAKLFEFMEGHLSADNLNLRFYGGTAFNTATVSKEWSTFGTFQFLIPRYEVFRYGEQTAFAVNVRVDEITEEKIKPLLEEIDGIDFTVQTSYIKPPPRVLDRTDLPDQRAWTNTFKKLFDERGKLQIEKIVLARKSTLKFDRSINPIALIKHLKDMTPDCYHFLFQTAVSQAFLGASPERLFKKSGRRLESEAMAGTNPRGKSEKEDTRLADDLMNSPKTIREHRFVVENIKNRFKELCTRTQADKTSQVLKLNNWQHLVTHFKGSLKDKVFTENIIANLHPTAATCGCPSDEALKLIQQLEPFARGWYAGPIGYVGFDDAEFAVAIRSGLVQKDSLSLFAGAGIVEDSAADKEWAEIENKIGNFLSVFKKQ